METELIPAIEKQFRGIGRGWARFAYGGSTGGWKPWPSRRSIPTTTTVHSWRVPIRWTFALIPPSTYTKIRTPFSDPAAPHGYFPSIVGIGILKSNPELVTAVQKALQALMNEGAYKQIIDKYGLLPVNSALINQKPASAYTAS